MLQIELDEAKDNIKNLAEDLKILLLPKDPNDERNVIVEIRGGAGGEESALFSAVLFRMYLMYAEKKGFKIEIINANETEIGGYKEISFMIEARVHTHALSTKAVFTVFSEYPKPKVRAEFTHRQQPLRFCPRQKMLSLKLIRMT